MGVLRITANDQALLALEYTDDASQLSGEQTGHPIIDLVVAQLNEYFGGQRREFEIPLSLEGTEFQRHVWQGLMKIPYGMTASYKDVAEQIGRPRAMRAVGTANGRNRLPIIIPCHRVIAHDGSLGGYSSGLENKKWLLAHETRFT